MKRITVIGGGTGTFIVLSALKNCPIDLGVIVSMMDSGGSTGKLKDQLGVLPPGDLRQCLVALSEAPLFLEKTFFCIVLKLEIWRVIILEISFFLL